MMNTNMAFNLEMFQIYHDYAEVYTNAVDEIRNRNRYVDQSMFIAEGNFEEYIQALHVIINEHILTLKKWEEKFDMVYAEPFKEIEDLIAIEHVYSLLKAGSFEGDELRFTLEWIDSGIDNYRNLRDTYKRYLDNPPIRMWLIRCDDGDIMTNYYDAEYTWKELEKTANAFLEDSNIPFNKKEWIAEYMHSDPYGNMCLKLEDKGLSRFGKPLR